MTLSVRQNPDVFALLNQVKIGGAGPVDVSALTSEQADKLLGAIAKDCLRQDGSVKSGYLRLVTGSDGRISSLTRSSVFTQGRTEMTGLISALAAKAWGTSAPDYQALQDYLQRPDNSRQQIGSRSLTKLVLGRQHSLNSTERAGTSLRPELQGRYRDVLSSQAVDRYLSKDPSLPGSKQGRLVMPERQARRLDAMPVEHRPLSPEEARRQADERMARLEQQALEEFEAARARREADPGQA